MLGDAPQNPFEYGDDLRADREGVVHGCPVRSTHVPGSPVPWKVAVSSCGCEAVSIFAGTLHPPGSQPGDKAEHVPCHETFGSTHRQSFCRAEPMTGLFPGAMVSPPRESTKQRRSVNISDEWWKIDNLTTLEAYSLVIRYKDPLSGDCISFLVWWLTRRAKCKLTVFMITGLFCLSPEPNLPRAGSPEFYCVEESQNDDSLEIRK